MPKTHDFLICKKKKKRVNLGLCASLLAPSNTTDWVSCNVFAAEHDSHLRNGEQVCSFVALFMLWGRSCWYKDDTNQRPHHWWIRYGDRQQVNLLTAPGILENFSNLCLRLLPPWNRWECRRGSLLLTPIWYFCRRFYTQENRPRWIPIFNVSGWHLKWNPV